MLIGLLVGMNGYEGYTMLPRSFLLRFFDILFGRFWLNILPIILLSAASIVYLIQPLYVSYASIYIQRTTLLDSLIAVRIRDEPFGGVQVVTVAQAMTNELNELIQTEAFARAVITKSELSEELNSSPDALERVLALYRESLTIQVQGDNLVEISVTADTPTLAQQFASATVETFRLWKVSRDVQDSQIAQSFFDEIIGPYQEELTLAEEDLLFYLERNPEPAVGARPIEEELQIARLTNAVITAENRLQEVLNKSESARLAAAQTERDVEQTYKVIDQPLVPVAPEPVAAKILLSLVFPVVGILLSLGIVLGRCAADQSLRNRLDVREQLELPVLAELRPVTPPAPSSARSQRTPRVTSPDEPLPSPGAS